MATSTEQNQKYYIENKESENKRAAAYLEANREAINKRKREHYAANKDRINNERLQKRIANPERHREQNKRKWAKDPEKWRKYYCDRQKNKKATDPKYRLHIRISKAVGKSIKKGSKGGESWPSLVGYSLADLESHLMKTVPSGYTWDDYLTGDLHLDHIVPVSVHNFETPHDTDFKRAWALSNLQLLPAFDNMSKGAKIDGEFQPSLAM